MAAFAVPVSRDPSPAGRLLCQIVNQAGVCKRLAPRRMALLGRGPAYQRAPSSAPWLPKVQAVMKAASWSGDGAGWTGRQAGNEAI